MQRIQDRLHLHRKNRAAAPLPVQNPLIKPTSAPLNAQGLPIVQPLSTLPASIPLTAQPSTLGKHPSGEVHSPTLLQQPLQSPTLVQQPLSSPTLLQQPILQQTTQQTFTQQPILQKNLPTQQWQQGTVPLQQGTVPLQQGFSLQKQGLGIQQHGIQNIQTITRPPIVESIVRPTKIEQTARIEKVVEVQPIIHRNVDAPQIRIIEQHTYEAAPLAGPTIVTNPTIVEEVVKPRVIEEVVPVIHREVPAPIIQRVEQHIQERVVQPTVNNKVIQQQSNVAIIQGQSRALPAQNVALQPTVMHQTAAAITESRTVPTVVQQTMVPEKVLSVQPIIHRTIDAPEVRLIEKHSFEKVRSTGPSVVYNQPLIQEVVTPRIIEDIQPVVHREVPQVVRERQEQHITENISQPTTTIKQVVQDRATRALPAVAQTRSLGTALPIAPSVRSVTAAPIVQSRTMPTVIQQTSRQEVIQEIQPIIHREIDAPEVRVIEQHSYEKVASTGPSTVTLAPVIQETLHPRVIEEIHPVLHRTVPQPFIERVEQHTNETITQPVRTTKQVLNSAPFLSTATHQQTFAAPLSGGINSFANPILGGNTLGSTTTQQTFAPLSGGINSFASPSLVGGNTLGSSRIPAPPPLPPKGYSTYRNQNGLQQGWSGANRNINQQQNWNLGQQQFAPVSSSIPQAPPLPSKRLTTAPLNYKMQQSSFASPMGRNLPLQQQQFAPLASNIPPAPPLPTSAQLSSKKLLQQQALGGGFQQAGGARYI